MNTSLHFLSYILKVIESNTKLVQPETNGFTRQLTKTAAVDPWSFNRYATHLDLKLFYEQDMGTFMTFVSKNNPSWSWQIYWLLFLWCMIIKSVHTSWNEQQVKSFTLINFSWHIFCFIYLTHFKIEILINRMAPLR